jgi:hypothetical protein
MKMEKEKKKSHPLLGALEYQCEKHPLWTALYRANGGVLGLLFIFGIFTPLMTLGVSLVFYSQMHGGPLPEKGLTHLLPYILPSAAIIIAVMGYLFSANYLYAKRVSLRLYEKGVVIGTAHGEISTQYHKLTAVYFGNRNQGMNLYLTVGKVFASGVTSMVNDQLKSRLTFEIKDSKGVALVYLDRYFKAESVVVFLTLLEQHTSHADGVITDYVSQ